MAIIYNKGKKDLKYTGIDKVMHKFGNAVEKVKGGVRRAVKAIPEANKRYDKAQASKELDDISRGFGSVENYERLYPETKKRHDKLRERAYGTK
jgi:hypothetical protein